MAADLPSVFKLERYFDKYEFTTKHLLCCSDAEPLSMKELVDMADDECKGLWENLKLSYTESKGHHLLRQEAAKLHGVDAEDMLVITPQEGIYIAMRCLVHLIQRKTNKKSFHAIATYPAYQSLYENLKTMGCELSYWSADETGEGWNFDMDKLKGMIREDTKLLVVNFPHNPTGFIPSLESWTSLIRLCQSRDMFLFSDEMYRLSNNDGSVPLDSAAALYTNAISLSGMSKTFALPGLRIGWLATKNQDIMPMMSGLKDFTTICSSGPSEILSIIGLRNSEKLVDHTLGIVKKNLKVLDAFFQRYPQLFVWHKPKAGTAGFVRLKSWLLTIGTTGGATGFCDKLVKEKQVLLAPAAMFDHVDVYVRVGFGRRDLPECVEVLEEFIKENTPQ